MVVVSGGWLKGVFQSLFWGRGAISRLGDEVAHVSVFLFLSVLIRMPHSDHFPVMTARFIMCL